MLSLWAPVRPGLVDIVGILVNVGRPTAPVTATPLRALHNQAEAFN